MNYLVASLGNVFRLGSLLCCLILITSGCSVPPVARAGAGRTGDPGPFDAELLSRINRYRVERGAGALRIDPLLGHLALAHSTAMSRQGRLSHHGFEERYHQAQSSSCVENVGWNHASAGEQFQAWVRSPGHNRNLLDQGVDRVGIGVVGAYVTYFACR